jgi:hypothetical protein
MSTEDLVTVRWLRPVPIEGFLIGTVRIRPGPQVRSTSVVSAEVARVLFSAGFSQQPPSIELLDGWEHVQELGDRAGTPA